MKVISGVVCALGILILTGCNEVARPDARSSSVDVVGEPSDSTPDPAQPTDIVGSGASSADDSLQLSNVTKPRDSESPATANPTQPAEGTSAPDVVGGVGQAKPVSLKSKK